MSGDKITCLLLFACVYLLARGKTRVLVFFVFLPIFRYSKSEEVKVKGNAKGRISSLIHFQPPRGKLYRAPCPSVPSSCRDGSLPFPFPWFAVRCRGWRRGGAEEGKSGGGRRQGCFVFSHGLTHQEGRQGPRVGGKEEEQLQEQPGQGLQVSAGAEGRGLGEEFTDGVVFCVSTCVLCVHLCSVCPPVFCVSTCVLCVHLCAVCPPVCCVSTWCCVSIYLLDLHIYKKRLNLYLS